MCNSEQSIITFETGGLEKIVHDPEWVLANQDLFWETTRAQILTRKWANNVNWEIDYDKWRASMTEWAQLSQEERQAHPLMEMTERLVASKATFNKLCLPHDRTFLPPGVDLSVTVQFTAFIPPFAFAMEDIVVDVASPYWISPNHVLNLMMHEVFHVGYGFYRDQQTEKGLVEASIYRILDNIANEGICTYVGYRALPIYPVEGERDYRMLADPSEVRRQIGETNQVFAQFGHLPEDELKKLSWDKGVMGRAYYVAGAYLCQVIDERTGRQALIEALSTGPLTMIARYNELVEPELRLLLPEIVFKPA